MPADLRIYKDGSEVANNSVNTLPTAIGAKDATDGGTFTYPFTVRNVGDATATNVFLIYEDDSGTVDANVGNAKFANITDTTGSVVTIDKDLSAEALAGGYVVLMDGETYELLSYSSATATTITTATAPTLLTATKLYTVELTASILATADWNQSLSVIVDPATASQDIIHQFRVIY